MTVTEPSPAELVRRIEELVRSVERLTNTMESTYATKESVQALRDLHGAEIAELKKDNDARNGTTRQIIAGLVVAFVMLLIPLIGFIQNVVAGGTP